MRRIKRHGGEAAGADIRKVHNEGVISTIFEV